MPRDDGVIRKRARALLAVTLAAALATLLSAHLIAATVWPDGSGYSQIFWRHFRMSDQFALGGERNLPTLYSAMLFMLGALAFKQGGDNTSPSLPATKIVLYFLASVFAFLAVDEAVTIHEHISARMGETAQQTAQVDRLMVPFIWIIPYGALTILGVVVALPWLRSLSSGTAPFLFLGIFAYATGALGFELLEGLRVLALGGWERSDTALFAMNTVEEALEIAGLSFIIYALARWSNQGVELLWRPRFLIAAAFLALAMYAYPHLVSDMAGNWPFWAVASVFVVAIQFITFFALPSHAAPNVAPRS